MAEPIQKFKYTDSDFSYATSNYSIDNMINDINNLETENEYMVRQLLYIRDNGLPTVPSQLRVSNSDLNTEEDDDLIGILDKSKSNTKTIDIVNEDTYSLIINENTMYITGTLACASLIIGAILLAR